MPTERMRGIAMRKPCTSYQSACRGDITERIPVFCSFNAFPAFIMKGTPSYGSVSKLGDAGIRPKSPYGHPILSSDNDTCWTARNTMPRPSPTAWGSWAQGAWNQT